MRVFFIALIFLSAAVFVIYENNFVRFPQKFFFTKPPVQEDQTLLPYPVRIKGFVQVPQISARSAVVIDAKTGIILYEKEPNLRHPPASVTKLMTAITSLEKCTPQTDVRINTPVSEGTLMGLDHGDLVSIQSLLYGMLIASGNDAAFALSYACADSYNQFIASMNQKAKELAMTNTHFTNPAGFDDSLHYSTAKDLAKLAKVAVASPLISKIVSTKSTIVTDVTGIKTYYLENINQLLGEVEGLEGVKTGQTEGSLEVLVTKTTRFKNTIIVVILGSNDRFGESKEIIEWAFKNHQWVSP